MERLLNFIEKDPPLSNEVTIFALNLQIRFIEHEEYDESKDGKHSISIKYKAVKDDYSANQKDY